MAITFTNHGASTPGTPVNPDIATSTDLSVYDNSSWTPPASGLLIAFIGSREAAGNNAITSFVHDPTGANVAWTSITTVQFGAGNVNRISLYAIDASTLGAGIDRLTFGTAQQHGSWSIFRADDVDLTGGIAAAFVQSPTNTDGGTAGTTASVTLAAAGDSDNRPIAGFLTAVQEDQSVAGGAGWTEMDDLTAAAPTRGLETQYKEDSFDTAPSSTWTTSARWGAIGAELKATSGEPPPVVTPLTFDPNILGYGAM